jgi:hypothetical protein
MAKNNNKQNTKHTIEFSNNTPAERATSPRPSRGLIEPTEGPP